MEVVELRAGEERGRFVKSRVNHVVVCFARGDFGVDGLDYRVVGNSFKSDFYLVCVLYLEVSVEYGVVDRLAGYLVRCDVAESSYGFSPSGSVPYKEKHLVVSVVCACRNVGEDFFFLCFAFTLGSCCCVFGDYGLCRVGGGQCLDVILVSARAG